MSFACSPNPAPVPGWVTICANPGTDAVLEVTTTTSGYSAPLDLHPCQEVFLPAGFVSAWVIDENNDVIPLGIVKA